MSLFLQPHLSDTVKSEDGRSWTAASAKDFLAELESIDAAARSADTGILYRGQEDFDWCLDSTIARTVKFNLFDFQSGEVPVERVAGDYWFIQALYGAFHFKFGGGLKPSSQLFELEEQYPEIDPWFELMKRFQQYPSEDHRILKGSHLLDWSVVPNVASWFAARRGDNDAAVHVWNFGLSGACHADWKIRDFLDRMEQHDWRQGAINSRPLIFCPKKQINMARANAQGARYVAQQDLRWPLDIDWRNQERELGTQLYLKVRIPAAMKTELIDLLAARGIDQAQLFPDLQDGEVI